MGYIKTYTDTDTNTQLSDAQIAEMGYIKTYTDTNTNTQLTSAQIAAMGYLSTATGLEVFRSEKNTDDQGTYMFAQDDGGWTGGARLAGAHNGYGVISMHLHTGSYYGQIHLSSLTSDMGIRFQENSTTWGSIYTVHTSKHFSTADVANGITAHGWGNHADAGYLTSYTDTNTTYGNTDFVDLTSAQTVGGIKTFTSDMVIKNGDPTLGFADTTANADDFYIHVNSNNFYVLADRDDSGLNNGISGWDGSHPLQLESDTNKAYTFGNEIYHTGNIPTWNQSTTGTANNATNLGGINASEYAHGTEGSFTVGGSRSNFYPVKLSKGRMRGVFTIYRENVHENGSSFGSGRLIIRATTSGWGHTPLKFSYEAIVQSQHLFGFLASNYRTSYMMVMLRGGTTYHYVGSDTFKLSDGNASGVSLSDGRTTYNATALALVDVNYSGEAPSYRHIPFTNHEYGDTSKNFSGGVTAPNFYGSLTGNASTATTATTAETSNLIKVHDYSSTTNMRILGSHQTGGSDHVYSNASMYLNCETGIINATGFNGYLAGNATTATTAANSLLLNGLTNSASGGSNKILASHATNGYLYINNWIHPANGTGMFYDAGVHFYETGNYMYSNTRFTSCKRHARTFVL